MFSGNQFHNLSVCHVNKLYLCCLIISLDSNSFSSVRNSEKSLSGHLFYLLSNFIDLYLLYFLTSLLEVQNAFLLILSSCQTHFMLLIIFLHFFFFSNFFCPFKEKKKTARHSNQRALECICLLLLPSTASWLAVSTPSAHISVGLTMLFPKSFFPAITNFEAIILPGFLFWIAVNNIGPRTCPLEFCISKGRV